MYLYWVHIGVYTQYPLFTQLISEVFMVSWGFYCNSSNTVAAFTSLSLLLILFLTYYPLGRMKWWLLILFFFQTEIIQVSFWLEREHQQSFSFSILSNQFLKCKTVYCELISINELLLIHLFIIDSVIAFCY